MKNNLARAIQYELDDLSAGFDILGIKYNKTIIAQFRIYLEILFRYRNKVHLLSHQDYACIARKHFLPALMALDYIQHKDRVCDIGAGPGFPSMPLKIIKPTIKLTLIEAKKKKADFLEVLVRELAYHDIEVINKRVQDYSGPAFKVILLKAVGKIKALIDPIGNLIMPDGRAIFFKTHQVEQEIENARKKIRSKGLSVHVEKFFTPLEHLPLGLIILQKIK